ncbi:MAG: cache domain-containing protein [Elusimicrobiaceae bacterium]|nr:cache domain-containing protein [Elusimicrobiaceae bacterium]
MAKTVVGLAVLLGICSGAFAQKYDNRETENLVKLVNSAAALVNKEGESAFEEFREPDSRWFHGDVYIFVWEVNGERVVYPADIDNEKASLADLKDLNGKPIGKWFIDAADAGGGWVHYYWPLRGGKKAYRWKSAFITSAASPKSGKKYLVGCGLYDLRTERIFLSDTVDAAAALIVRKGTAAFAEIEDRASRFIFSDVYVFVIDSTGTEQVDPLFPEYVGKNIMDLKDTDGHSFVREMFKKASAEKGVWVKYTWPRPGTEKPSVKMSYIRKVAVSGADYLVGAGVYQPDMGGGK